MPTLATYLPHWFSNGLVKGNKRQTQHSHTSFMNAAGAQFGELRLDEITPEQIRGWQRAMFLAKLAPGTINLRVVQLVSVLRLAISDRLISFLPEYEPVKSDRAEVDYFTREQVDALIDGAFARGRWLIARLIDIASRTGLRIGELRALKREDVKLDPGLASGEVTIRGSVARGRIDSTKSRDVRVLPLSPGAVVLFATLFAELDAKGYTSPFVFPGKRCERISSRELQEGFDDACEAGKVQRPTSIKACNSWHMLRHAFASEMKNLVDPLTLSMLMAHGRGRGDLRVTNRYLHTSRDQLRLAMLHADTGRRTVVPFPDTTYARTSQPTPPPDDTSAETALPLAA